MEPESIAREDKRRRRYGCSRLWTLISCLVIIEFYRRRLERITRLDKAISIR